MQHCAGTCVHVVCVDILRRRAANRTESGPAFSSGSSQGSSAAGLTPQAQRLRESLAGFFDQLYPAAAASAAGQSQRTDAAPPNATRIDQTTTELNFAGRNPSFTTTLKKSLSAETRVHTKSRKQSPRGRPMPERNTRPQQRRPATFRRDCDSIDAAAKGRLRQYRASAWAASTYVLHRWYPIVNPVVESPV